ncbi:uncharacterized protein LOC110753087 [Prunus avium]|uniref:Uncharacterized protein LOC110753087 n=1 Tax=Prunus avium TaxID=42229 RepID=A0A6P5S7X0_PRUAV|nr:uncharacterized protein LOC110753087 [Prunus avium]
MANLAKLEFAALDISSNNYLLWALDAKLHLEAHGLGDTIRDENNSSPEQNAKAMIFLRRHIHEGLKSEYLVIENPLELWKALEERYNHQKTVILPRARYEWTHLRFQDYKTVSEYNSAMHRITSTMKLCGENITDVEMLEKTFTTFHATNLLLQQQYRERGFTKYSQLVSCLLLAEQNNELLLKNHQSRPTGSAPFPEVNVVSKGINTTFSRGNTYKRRPRGGRGRGRRNDNHSVGLSARNDSVPKNASQHKGKFYMRNNSTPKTIEGICHRCGSNGHWARICRTPQHLVELYKSSQKERQTEVNFVDHFDSKNNPEGIFGIQSQLETTHLDISDFHA